MAIGDSSTPRQQGREPLTPSKRKRLQQIFEHASKQMAQGEHNYATELFASCVVADPGNLIYIQSYIGNLQKKYGNNKTGAKLAQFKERGARSAVKRALSQEQWDEVIRQGLKVLTVNPWDVTTLTSMATAANKMGDLEPEMCYLNCAWHANPKDPDVNRQVAMALEARDQFDQAIASWHRVEQARPGDEEAQKAIAHLAVKKTIRLGGYDTDDESKKLAGKRPGQAGQPGQPQQELSLEERLRRRIDRDPQDLSNYYELAQYYLNEEQYQKAESVLAKALEVSDGDEEVRDRLEDAQLRRLRQQVTQTQDPEQRKNLRAEFLQKELDVCRRRCERYPNNLAFHYDLGLRYQLTGDYQNAIKEFQQARNDPRRKGLCMLALGQCFQQIKQNRLAMSHYETAIEEIPDRDAENKKKALYLAGKMARALKDRAMAEKHLTRLAAVDFTYKDVSTLLESLSGGPSEEDSGERLFSVDEEE